MLAQVANSWDVLRAAIETVKDEVCNREWTIRMKKKDRESKNERMKRAENDPDLKRITELFQTPDGVHPFRTWLRMWLEQMLVYDAPTVNIVRNRLGEVIALRVIDGATITPLVDEQGFIPLPPDPAYQQIILGVPVGNLVSVTTRDQLASAASDEKKVKQFTSNQIVYTPRNPRCNSRWGYSPVEQLIATLAIASRRQEFLKDYYTDGNIPAALIQVPDTWHTDQIKSVQNWLDMMLAGNLKARRKAILIPGGTGTKVEWAKSGALTDETEDYLIRVVCFTLSVSSQGLRKAMNRASAQQGSDDAIEQGVEPRLKHIEDAMNIIVQKIMGAVDIEFAFSDARETDVLKQAQADKIYIDSGVRTINECKVNLGDEPFDTPEANEPYILTATGPIFLNQAIATARATAMAAAVPKPQLPAPTGGDNSQGPTSTTSAKKAQKSEVVGQVTMPGAPTERNKMVQSDIAKAVKRGFRSQRKTVSSAAEKVYASLLYNQFSEAKAAEPSTEDEFHKHLAEAIALIPWDYDILTEDFRSNLTEAAKEGAWQGSNQISSALSGEVSTSAYGQALQRAVEYGVQRSTDLTSSNPDAEYRLMDSAKDEVAKTLEQAAKENWTPDQVKAVVAAVKALSDDRADLIAQQETLRAQSVGWVEAWGTSRKVAKVAWRLSPLHKGVDICDVYSSHGEVTLGHAFDKGVYMPSDAHPNCGCYLEITEFAA
jgi:hypothetical protein